jgi:hypothetical protein
MSSQHRAMVDSSTLVKTETCNQKGAVKSTYKCDETCDFAKALEAAAKVEFYENPNGLVEKILRDIWNRPVPYRPELFDAIQINKGGEPLLRVSREDSEQKGYTRVFELNAVYRALRDQDYADRILCALDGR